jgi:hypothetical protein
MWLFRQILYNIYLFSKVYHLSFFGSCGFGGRATCSHQYFRFRWHRFESGCHHFIFFLTFSLFIRFLVFCDHFKVMQKVKKGIICKNIFKNHFEFSVTESQTRAQGFKSKTLTHPAMEACTKKAL